jgi:hypothetical protein
VHCAIAIFSAIRRASSREQIGRGASAGLLPIVDGAEPVGVTDHEERPVVFDVPWRRETAPPFTSADIDSFDRKDEAKCELCVAYIIIAMRGLLSNLVTYCQVYFARYSGGK